MAKRGPYRRANSRKWRQQNQTKKPNRKPRENWRRKPGTHLHRQQTIKLIGNTDQSNVVSNDKQQPRQKPKNENPHNQEDPQQPEPQPPKHKLNHPQATTNQKRHKNNVY